MNILIPKKKKNIQKNLCLKIVAPRPDEGRRLQQIG